jgi:hypothetical protein
MSNSGHCNRPTNVERRSRSVTSATLTVLESLAERALSGDMAAANVLLNQMAPATQQGGSLAAVSAAQAQKKSTVPTGEGIL